MVGLDWFLTRIGKNVSAHSYWWGITRIIKIKSKRHASELYNWYYKYKNWQFSDI